MHRPVTGKIVTQSTQGETVRAFVPNPLPPVPPIAWNTPLIMAQQRAATALGRLDGITALLPDPAIFLYSYVRKEAVLSSQIEGTQSSLSDLLTYESAHAPGVPVDDVVEVSNYVCALTHGLRRLEEGFPLCLRLVREIHEVLLSKGRGSGKQPGAFRLSQNWIGGSRPGNAAFVPTPHEALPECLAAWESFLHSATDPLTKAALAHVQFETMHPFLDGNGRVGRLLISLILSTEGVLKEPMLYLSLFLKQHRSTYYDLLQKVRQDGDWEGWLDFFFQGVTETSDGAVATAKSLLARFEVDRKVILNKRAAASSLQVHHHLQGHPISTSSAICQATGLTPATVNKALDHLGSLGILKEITGGQRNRLFTYGRVLELLSEGTEP
jgi:Fic family protein